MKIKNISEIKSIFLDNRTVKQTILKNTFWLGLSTFIGRILTFFLFVYVARILGATEYGIFTFALSFVYLLNILSDFGVSRIIIRELSCEKQDVAEYPGLLSLKIILILATLAIIVIGSFFVTADPAIQKVIWILAAYNLIGSFALIVYALFEARQKMEYKAWAEILQAALFTAFGFFVIFNFPSAENLGYAYLVGTLIFIVILLVFFHLRFYRLRLSWNPAVWRKFLRMSWPLALAGFFATIYSQIDSVMMGALGQITQTGWYNAALRITTFTFLPAMLFSQSAYPAASIAFKESRERLQKIWNYHMELMISLVLPLVVGGLVLAPQIILFIYDSNFLPSVFAFQILLFMTGFLFLSSPLNTVLVASNQEKKIFWVALAGMIINIILNALLIPKYSLYGAALTTVITYGLMFILLFRFISESTPVRPFNLKLFFVLLVAVLSTAVMYFVITLPLFARLHVLVLILVGAVVYFSILLALRFIVRGLKL